MNKELEVRKLVAIALARIGHVSTKSYTSQRLNLDKVGLDQSFKKTIKDLVIGMAWDKGIPLTETEFDQLGIGPSRRRSARTATKTASRSRAAATAYPAIKAARDVAAVIGRFKNVNPSGVAASDNLQKWFFTPQEKRAIGQSINLYYFNVLHLVMDYWIHPEETKDVTFVHELIRIVLAHNPHRPPNMTATLNMRRARASAQKRSKSRMARRRK